MILFLQVREKSSWRAGDSLLRSSHPETPSVPPASDVTLQSAWRGAVTRNAVSLSRWLEHMEATESGEEVQGWIQPMVASLPQPRQGCPV